MKKSYLSPELEITLLTSEDILSGSDEVQKEVEVDGSDLFSEG